MESLLELNTDVFASIISLFYQCHYFSTWKSLKSKDRLGTCFKTQYICSKKKKKKFSWSAHICIQSVSQNLQDPFTDHKYISQDTTEFQAKIWAYLFLPLPWPTYLVTENWRKLFLCSISYILFLPSPCQGKAASDWFSTSLSYIFLHPGLDQGMGTAIKNGWPTDQLLEPLDHLPNSDIW